MTAATNPSQLADLLLSLTALHLTGMGPHVSGIIAAGGSERVIGQASNADAAAAPPLAQPLLRPHPLPRLPARCLLAAADPACCLPAGCVAQPCALCWRN